MKWFLIILIVLGAVAAFVYEEDFDLHGWLVNSTLDEESVSILDRTELEKVVLTDREGRDLPCQILSLKGQELTIIRTSDHQKFSFNMDRLDRDSLEKVEAWQDKHTGGHADEYHEYQQAKESVRVEVVISENIDATPEVKRFLTAQDFNYVVYDAFKSTKGRRLLERHDLTHGPAFIIGDQVVVGLNLHEIRQAIIKEYRRQQSGT